EQQPALKAAAARREEDFVVHGNWPCVDMDSGGGNGALEFAIRRGIRERIVARKTARSVVAKDARKWESRSVEHAVRDEHVQPVALNDFHFRMVEGERPRVGRRSVEKYGA